MDSNPGLSRLLNVITPVFIKGCQSDIDATKKKKCEERGQAQRSAILRLLRQMKEL